jgi:hypothetical protein
MLGAFSNAVKPGFGIVTANWLKPEASDAVRILTLNVEAHHDPPMLTKAGDTYEAESCPSEPSQRITNRS